MQGSELLVQGTSGSAAIFVISMYLSLFFYFFRRYFLDQLLNQASFYFSSWGNKVQNICYTTLTSFLYLVYIIVATIINRSPSSISLILTVDIARNGYLGYHLAKDLKQVNFPTSVGIRNLILSLLCQICLFLTLLLKKQVLPPIFMLVIYALYILMVVAH